MTKATSKSESAESTKMVRALDHFVLSKELGSLEQALGGFNLFRTLGITDKELFHSRLLAWLIKPHESHGLGDLFLRRWLMRILLGSTAANPHSPTLSDVDGAKWVEVVVATEVPLKTGQRLDVEATLHLRGQPLEQRWWVVVETKVGSSQGVDQLANYRTAVEAKSKTDEKRVFVFLTRDLERPNDAAWHKAAFDSVHETLKECLEIREGSIADGPGLLLRDYVRILEEQFMNDSKVAERVRAIFKEHPEAMAAIEANWPDPMRELIRYLHAFLTGKGTELGVQVLSTRAKDYFRFIAKSWNVDLTAPAVVGYVEVDAKTVSIRLYATPDCPEDKKRTLVKASKLAPFQRVKRTQSDDADTPTLDSGWNEQLLIDVDATKVHSDAAEKIEKELKSGRLPDVFGEIQKILS